MSIFKPQTKTETRTDHTWIRHLKQKEAQAVQSLWEMVFTDGVTLARYYKQEDDIGREAAIAAFHRIQNRGVHQFRFQSPFSAYCRQIVVNEVKRRLKKQNKRHKHIAPVELHDEIQEDTSVNDPSVVETTEQHIWRRLEPCLELLPSRKRDVIQRQYFEETTPQSIANEMNIRRGNVNKIAHDARLKLRECLERYGFFTTGDVLGL